MTNPNWGLLNAGGGFQNALASGFQMGSQVRQQREEKEYRNALLQQRQQETDQRLAERQAAMAKEQQTKQQADAGTMRKLLMHAKTNPQQALQAAQGMGIDVSRIPAMDSPDFQPWVDQQLFIADAIDKTDPEELKGIAYELEMAGYKPGTTEFEQAARSVISNKYASEYVDDAGNTRRRSALNLESPVAYDPNEWEEVEQGGPQAAPAATFP